jgi:hypothetical protein
MTMSRPKLVDIGIVLAACVVLVLFRLHAFDLPLETDEANYAYIGASLLDGDRLYINVWDHQPPGVFLLFAGAIALFGDSPAVFRWLATAFSIVSLALIFAILRRISGRPAATLGAVLFCVVSSDPGTGGEGANREIYMNTLILAAWWIALRGWVNVCEIAPLIPKDNSPPHFFSGPCSPGQRFLCTFAAGLALGIASLFKTNAAVYWVFLAAWIAVQAWIVAPAKPLRKMLIAFAGFAFGPVLVWASTLGYFAVTNRLHEFIDAVFLVNLDYARADGSYFLRFWTFFDPPRFDHIFDSAFPLWIGAAAALAWLLKTAVVRPGASVMHVAALMLAGYVAVCLPGRFWPHYYYLLIPPAVIAVSLFIVALLHASAEFIGRRRQTAAMAVIASGLVVAVLLANEYTHYLSKEGLDLTIQRYNTRDFWGRAQGENVARVTSSNDSVFVYGNDAAIYYYSKRTCASRYTMITGLHPRIRGARDRQQVLLNELRAHPPRLIIDIERAFEGWTEFLLEKYDPVGADFNDVTSKPIMAVFARKDAPIESIDWNWDRSQAVPRMEPVQDH